jgi:hypothetical protein
VPISILTKGFNVGFVSGAGYVEAPLLGTNEPAVAGTLTVLAASPQADARRRVQPVRRRGHLPRVASIATVHALPILARYRDKLLTFNDDIQGTAAVTLGALHGAAKVAARPLSQQQIVMLGAGSAGIGVLDMIRQEMMTEGLVAAQAVADGVAPKRSNEELTQRIAEVHWTPDYPTAPV